MPDWLSWFPLNLLMGGAAGAAAAFLAKAWIEARLIASIKHEYAQSLERFRKVETLAELFAEWTAIPEGEPYSRAERTRLNQLAFTAAIWLPANIVVEASKTLQAQDGAKTYFEILLLARKELTHDESLKPENLTFWGPEFERIVPPPNFIFKHSQ